jgi:hypothetical protein
MSTNCVDNHTHLNNGKDNQQRITNANQIKHNYDVIIDEFYACQIPPPNLSSVETRVVDFLKQFEDRGG